MDAAQHTGIMGAGHLCQIQEEMDSREPSSLCPPAGIQQTTPADVTEADEVCDPEPTSVEDDGSLLDELTRIEAELQQTLRLDVERQQEAEFLREQENLLLQQNLCHLTLSQRVAKPWVSSYFRRFPMHIYCLPVQQVHHRGRRRGLKKTPRRGDAS